MVILLLSVGLPVVVLRRALGPIVNMVVLIEHLFYVGNCIAAMRSIRWSYPTNLCLLITRVKICDQLSRQSVQALKGRPRNRSRRASL